MDGTTDAGNLEELLLILYFDPSSDDGVIHVRNQFFTVQQLRSGAGAGLFQCLIAAMAYMGVDDWKSNVIGLGCDGTNANIAAGGLRGHLEEEVPWVTVFWCLAHRLELALKDALKGTFFADVDELLLQVYFLYDKSPKKCCELAAIAEELQGCLEPANRPSSGGVRPLRACGPRFVAHKVSVGRVLWHISQPSGNTY